MKELPTLPPSFTEEDTAHSSKPKPAKSPRILPVDADLEVAESVYSEACVEQGAPFIVKSGRRGQVEPLPVAID